MASPTADTSTRPDLEQPGLDARLLTEAITGLRRALRSSVRTELPPETLPIAQVEILQPLAEARTASARQLAERLRLAPNTVSGLLTRLMTAGPADRGTDPRDRHRAVVQLTDEGRDHLAARARTADRGRAGALDPGERAALASALPAMNSLVHRLHCQLATRPSGRLI